MRRPRVKVDGEGFYHVVSRIGGKRFLIDEDEKRILLGMIRGAAAFSGVELYTFAVMSNHFHLLVRVPRKKAVSDKELERRMLAWYGPGKFAAILEKWEKWTKKKRPDLVEDEKARMRARMYDLSQFCKTFKEAYTQDYNKRHENTGTIWEGRFKSILLEGSFRALMTVAGYVHLNPVRAAMVERPEESRWTGYGAACHEDFAAQDGLRSLVSRACGAKDTDWNEAKRACANAIEGKVPERSARPEDAPLPEDVVETDGKGRPVRAGSLRALLTRRVAGFLHGGALGEERFLKRVAEYLPPRVRRRAEGLFDRCPFLGLASAAGVREVS
jgi:REP element-mobilizing transposase RayT